MAWRIVKQPNGLLARFSEVVDDFTHYDMTEAEAVEVCQEDMGRADAEAKVRRGINDEPHPFMNERDATDGLGRFRDAIETIRTIHGDELADERLRELSRRN